MAAKSLGNMTPKQAARAIIHTLLIHNFQQPADLAEHYPEASQSQLERTANFLEADINRIITRYGYEPITIKGQS